MPSFAPRLCLVLAALLAGPCLLAACGDPPRSEVVRGEPTSFLAGVDRDSPIPDRPGFRRKEILSRAYELPAWRVNIHSEPFRVSPFSREEDVWITGWRSNTEDDHGVRAPDDIHCHALFSSQPVEQDEEQDFRGLFTDGYSPSFTLPEGFAVRVRKGERMIFQPMFNNRRPEGRTARMRLQIDYVPHSKRPRDYRELRAATLTATAADLYWVEAGQVDRRARELDARFQGRIHAIGAHLHPYGELVELERVSTKEVLATCRLHHARKIEDERLDILHFPKGIYVRRGEKLQVSAVYNNKSDEKIDAMGGFYVLYDPKGKPDA